MNALVAIEFHQAAGTGTFTETGDVLPVPDLVAQMYTVRDLFAWLRLGRW